MRSVGKIDEAGGRPVRKPFWPNIRGMMAIVAVYALLFGTFSCSMHIREYARDGARRAQCVNNLKQIGLALAAYAEQHGSYPTGSLPNPDLPVDRRLGWMYAVIPFLDYSGPKATDFLDRAWDDPVFQPYVSLTWGPACCPSSVASRSSTSSPAPANYVAIAGIGLDAPGLPKRDPRAGYFGDDRVATPADVTDGLGQTMMVVESFRPAGPWFAGGRNTVRGLDPSRHPYIGEGRQFGGIHVAGGANVLMADGSVKFVKDTVDPKVFEAMSTIAGGEKVSVP
jgi:prepilin-type processing-associated H-X9-DG protein